MCGSALDGACLGALDRKEKNATNSAVDRVDEALGCRRGGLHN